MGHSWRDAPEFRWGRDRGAHAMTGLAEHAFVTDDRSFSAVTGARPSLSVLARSDAHEGPTYLPEDDSLYVTTVPGGRPPSARIDRIDLDGDRGDLGPERITTVPGNPVLPNGMTAAGARLLVCEQGDLEHPARISALDPRSGATTALVQAHDGQPLNSPNDVVVRRDGTIWFTDPSYGHLQGFRPSPRLPDAVHRFDPRTGAHRIVAADLDKPNGLVFSPDDTVLYVADSGAVQGPGTYVPSRPHRVYAYDVVGGHLAGRRVVDAATPGTPDGLAVDEEGRLYVCCADGVRVLTPDGTLLGRIAVPGGAVNLTFGGRDRDRLFITADTAVWTAVLNTRGAELP